MNDTDRAFYDVAMAEADLFVSAGYRSPRPPVSDDDLRRLDDAWNDPGFYEVAMAEAESFHPAGYFGPAPRLPISDAGNGTTHTHPTTPAPA